MTDIFREIDEELRRDRLEKLWDRYAHYIIALAVLIVVATAAVVGWRQYQARERRAESVEYSAALQLAARGDPAGAAKALDELAGKAAVGYATLARLQSAAMKVQSGDRNAAIATYDALAADGGVDPLYRDLASLMAAQQMLETGEPKAVVDRLKPLTDGDSPWRPSALEVTGLAQLKAGDKAAALDTFKRLADDLSAPQGVRARAAEMITALNS